MVQLWNSSLDQNIATSAKPEGSRKKYNVTEVCIFFFPLEGMLTVSLSVKSDIITDDNIEHLVYSKIPITPTWLHKASKLTY